MVSARVLLFEGGGAGWADGEGVWGCRGSGYKGSLCPERAMMSGIAASIHGSIGAVGIGIGLEGMLQCNFIGTVKGYRYQVNPQS